MGQGGNLIDKDSPKNEVTDLAYFGGSASFVKPIVVGKPNVPDIGGVLEDVRSILESGMLSNNGPYVRRFEEEICRISGVEHCVAVCNATIGLEMTARALDLTGEVILPSFTFVATAHALAWHGLAPVFVDVDPETHTINPASVEAAITPATTAICGVHLWGNACNVAALQSIADCHGLQLWFDAAHAFAAHASGKRVGKFGRAEVFSFHATKLLNTFEGGAIATDDLVLARSLREMRDFGYGEEGAVVQLGVNGKMSEVSAAMGLNSLAHLDDTLAVSRRNVHVYATLLDGCPGIHVRAPREDSGSNCSYVVCEVDECEAGISRDLLYSILEAEGIRTKKYFSPACHQTAPYRDAHRARGLSLPITERLAETVLVLPTGIKVGVDDIERICALIRFVVDSSDEIGRELASRNLIDSHTPIAVDA